MNLALQLGLVVVVGLALLFLMFRESRRWKRMSSPPPAESTLGSAIAQRLAAYFGTHPDEQYATRVNPAEEGQRILQILEETPDILGLSHLWRLAEEGIQANKLPNFPKIGTEEFFIRRALIGDVCQAWSRSQ